MSNFVKLASISLLIIVLLAACSPKPQAASMDFSMASMSGMPDTVKTAARTVQTAYQFAVANPDVLKQIPCYCGCGAAGHHSNYACYVKSDSGGTIEYDLHATGCSICVDITQDTMRLLKEGKPVQEIKQTIDQTYARFGPSNMP